MTSESIFWNKHEARLRAGWRLAIQITLNIGLAVSLLALAVYFGGPLASQSPWSNVMVSLMFLGVTLLSVWSAGRFLDKRHFSDFGMLLNRRAWWADFAFGLALGSGLPVGLVLIALATGVATLEPVFTSGMTSVPFVVAVLLSALAFTCIGTFEELARAYHVRNLLEGFNKGVGLKGAMVMAVMGASAVSVLMHRGNTAFLFYVLVSTVVKGLCYLLTSRVAIAMAYHIAWDFVLATLFGFGAQDASVTATLFVIHLAGVAQATGSGTSLTSLAMLSLLVSELVGLLSILGWVQLRYGKIRLHEELAVPNLLPQKSD